MRSLLEAMAIKEHKAKGMVPRNQHFSSALARHSASVPPRIAANRFIHAAMARARNANELLKAYRSKHRDVWRQGRRNAGKHALFVGVSAAAATFQFSKPCVRYWLLKAIDPQLGN